MATHCSVFPGESHGQRSLAGYSSWGRKESDTTERLPLQGFREAVSLPAPAFVSQPPGPPRNSHQASSSFSRF